MSNILLIDLSSICHPLFHTSASDPDPNATSTKTVARVRALASGQPHVAVCCDSGRSFRKDLSADYKANRPASDATLQHQIALAIDVLKADGFPVWSVKGFEADDLLASATMLALKSPDFTVPNKLEPIFELPSVLIASSDKDLLQLVGARVTVKSLTSDNLYDLEAVMAKFGVTPNQMRDYLSLVGDASDNIKGAKGIGAKGAAQLLNTFGNLDDLYAAMDKGEAKLTPKLAESLVEFRARLPLTRELVTLRVDAPIPFDEIFKERVPADVATFGDEVQAPSEPVTAAPPQSGAAHAGNPSEPNGGASATSPTNESDGMGVKVASGQPPPTGRDPVGPSAPSQALAVREPEILPPPATDPRWQLEPRSLAQAIDLAKHMHASRLFSAYGTPQAVLSTIMAGRELGMQAQASLRAFHIIDGKPSESADLIRAQCLQSPHCEYFRIVERGPTKATWVTKRKGDPEVSLTYTIEEGRQAWAKDAKAWDNSGWGKRPANMVTKTAAATLARLVYPDVVLGMYCPEELTGQEMM